MSKELLGALIFGIASLTDWLDGYLARRRKQITGFGQWMDPLADKLLVTAALVSLVYLELAPAWMVVVILFREFAVTVLRSMAHARGHALPASPLGKVKLVAQVAAILILILGRGHMRGLLHSRPDRIVDRDDRGAGLRDRLLPSDQRASWPRNRPRLPPRRPGRRALTGDRSERGIGLAPDFPLVLMNATRFFASALRLLAGNSASNRS